MSEHGTGNRNRIGTGNGTGNLGSWCEAVIVMLQGLMSSKVELVQGYDEGV